MKRYLFSVFVTLFLVSCASSSIRYLTMSVEEKAQVDILGSVTADFTASMADEEQLKNQALTELKKEASKHGFTGNIDIRNIVISPSGGGIKTLAGMYTMGTVKFLTASGDVVLYNAAKGAQQKVPEAVKRVSVVIVEDLPSDATIAVLGIYSNDNELSETVITELEYALVRAKKFNVVDRRRLDEIRKEQNFGMSGEVSDDSAVSIGHLLGASIVLTGDISGAETTQRLNIKALDVKTGKIVTMAREQF